MKNEFIIEHVEVRDSNIIFNYKINGEWKKYFKERNQYSIEYSEPVGKCPKSIAVVPLLTNILPVAWLFDATIKVNEIDEDFLESIKDFKSGYENMYPNIAFKGRLDIGRVVKNKVKRTNCVGAFYSGGLDATSTLASHYDERPVLMNIQGSDVKVKHKATIKSIQKVLAGNAKELGLQIIFIKSEFRKVLDTKKLDHYIRKFINDNYWHAFQHGIAIIGHGAPVAFVNNLKNIYIASSFTIGDKVACASDPTIDNFVRFSGTRTIHDGYEMDRIAKTKNIGRFLKENGNKKISLRVCLDDFRVENCCHCEKCYRTIYGFIATGFDPKKFGFNLDKNFHKRVQREFKTMLILENLWFWTKIQNEFKNNPNLKNNKDLQWIYEYDFEKCNKNKLKYIVKYTNAIIRRIKKMVILIKMR